jgi:hypothetical protein
VAVKVSHQANKRKNPAFERPLEAISIGAINGGEIGVVVRVSEKNIPTGGNLRVDGSAKNQTSGSECGDLKKAGKPS